MTKTATLYRMSSDEHLCPFGLKTRGLLQRQGYDVDDHKLRTRDEVEAFKQEHNVETTPQTFIDNERIGGYEAVRRYFGLGEEKPEGTTYTPVIAIFSVCLLLAIAVAWRSPGTIFALDTVKYFIALSMAVLAIQKLQDLSAFSNQFITYDLLSMREPRYAYVYPFGEAYAGIGMLAGFHPWLVAPVALIIGTVGAVSVFKAVYIDKRELRCACVGGDSQVPLGFISLTENLFMILAAFWMWMG